MGSLLILNLSSFYLDCAKSLLFFFSFNFVVKSNKLANYIILCMMKMMMMMTNKQCKINNKQTIETCIIILYVSKLSFIQNCSNDDDDDDDDISSS